MAETIGSLIDKISIMELKIYHMKLQTTRPDVSGDHKEASKRKLEILNVQRKDLSEELNELTVDVLSGKRILKVYRQFKMYNDPKYRLRTSSSRS